MPWWTALSRLPMLRFWPRSPPPVGALTLPALISPSADAPSSEAAFALHNASGKALRLELRPQPLTAAAIAAAGGSGSGGATLSSGAAGSLRLDLELLSQHSGTPLSSLLTLAAGERLNLIVRARLPTAVALVCTFGQPLVFGSLAVRSFVSGLDADGWGAQRVLSRRPMETRSASSTTRLRSLGASAEGSLFDQRVAAPLLLRVDRRRRSFYVARLPPWSYQLSPQMSSSPPPQTESLWIRNLSPMGRLRSISAPPFRCRSPAFLCDRRARRSRQAARFRCWSCLRRAPPPPALPSPPPLPAPRRCTCRCRTPAAVAPEARPYHPRQTRPGQRWRRTFAAALRHRR